MRVKLEEAIFVKIRKVYRFFFYVENAAEKFAWHPFKGCYLLIN